MSNVLLTSQYILYVDVEKTVVYLLEVGSRALSVAETYFYVNIYIYDVNVKV